MSALVGMDSPPPTPSLREGASESREVWLSRFGSETNPPPTPSHWEGAAELRDGAVKRSPRRTRLEAARVRRAGLSAESQVLVREPAA